MSEAKDMTVRDLLAAATQQRPEDRSAFLDEACRGDQQLREEVQSLLSAFEEDDDFLGVPAMAHPALVPEGTKEGPGMRIGRYELMDLIGEGGFGSVFRARQQHPVRRDVALKIVKPGRDTRRVIARFNAERQALAMMNHPHIAKVLEAGATDAGRPYFVMELVEGVPVTRYCDEHKLSIRQRLELFIQVCQAVQHAHTKGIIHRDLKPSNILIARDDGVPVPKVIDFGIAKATQGRLTEQSVTTDQQHWLGTPQYMSPEQADGGADIDTRTDVYSLGVILYELLCGTAPFDFKSSGCSEIQRLIREQDPPPPSSKTQQRELRGDLDRIVLKAMEKDRTRRYETASGLAADIQRYLNNEPVTARETGSFYRFRKLVRRNRLVFAAAAAVALSLAAGLITSTALYIKARDAKIAESVLREDAEAKAYASDMLRIQQALSVYNLGEARMLLGRHRPKPGETDRRGWEWRYLWQQCRSEATAVLCQRPAAICSLSVSSDGRWLAIGDDEGGGLSVWDLQTRKESDRIPAGEFHVHTGFSPREPLLGYTSATSDANGHWRGQVHLWDLRTRKVTATADLNDYSQGLAFSSDGKTLLTSTAGFHGELTVWDIPTLTKGKSFRVENAFGSLGAYLAATADLSAAAVAPDEKVRVIDLTTGNERWQEDLAPGWATSIALSRDGRVLAYSTGTTNPTIHLLDAVTKKQLGPPLEGHLAWVSELIFRRDGKTLISASADQTIRIWDVTQPAHAKLIGHPLRGHTHEVRRLALLSDDVTLVSGAKDGSVCLWDLSRVNQDDSSASFPAVDFAFEGKGALLFSIDRQGRVWQRDGADLLAASLVVDIKKSVVGAYLLGGRLLISHSAAPSASGRTAGSLEVGDILESWDLEKKERLQTRSPVFEGDSEYDRATPQGRWLWYTADDNAVREWDLRSGRDMAPWRAPGTIVAMAFTADGRTRLTLTYGGTGILNNVEAGWQKPVSLDAREVCDASFSADGTMLVVSEGGYVGLWKTADLDAPGKVAPVVRLGGFSAAPNYLRPWRALTPRSVAFSPDGRRIAAGRQRSEAIKIWDVDSRQEVLNLTASGSLFGHTEFSPDGNVLASRNTEGELHVWRAPTLAEIDAAEANQAGR